jgi:hypothetical protein
MAASEPPTGRRWWRDVAVTGLLVTLIFNTVGVWLQVEQSQETKEATQLGLLTQLNVTAKSSEAQINATDIPDRRCKRDQIGQLKDAQEAALVEALDFYDYLAWLFSREHVTLQGADEYLAPRMIDAFAVGRAFMPPKQLGRDFAYLKAFGDRVPAAWHPPDPCA